MVMIFKSVSVNKTRSSAQLLVR